MALDEDPQPRLKDLTVLYNDTRDVRRGDPTDHLPEADESLAPVLEALAPLAEQVRPLGVRYGNLSALAQLKTDFVLNLCDGTGLDGHPGTEVLVALERRGLRYSGAGPRAYWLTCSKSRMKRALARAGVPVPPGFVAERPDLLVPRGVRYPLFVKPRDGYGSLGIDLGSRVHSRAELSARVQHLLDTVGPGVLVEQYIDGREISVGLVGPAEAPLVLPPLEVVFGPAHALPVRTFATKHARDSELYRDFRTVCPAELSPEHLAAVESVAREAYAALGCEGYARVDLRLDPAGVPWVLEVNANCSLEVGDSEEDCALLPLMARAHGWNLGRLLAALIRHGLTRAPTTDVPAATVRWRAGRASVRALRRLVVGERLAPLSEAEHEGEARHLVHAAEPNLRLSQRGRARWLEVAREVRPGEVLTVDRAALSGSVAAVDAAGSARPTGATALPSPRARRAARCA